MTENIENAENSAENKVQVKRSVRDFLNKYRQLGLPGAKRFRRRTRLQQAAWEADVNKAYTKALVHTLAQYRAVIDELKKEENWAVRGEDVVWIGESDPLEIIKKLEEGL